jgi:para-aminobenzoate synthetase component 1
VAVDPAAQRHAVIVREAPALPPAEAARRVAAAGAEPIWLSSPDPLAVSIWEAAESAGRPSARAGHPVSIRCDVVAADPWLVVRGRPVSEVDDAWKAARERWSSAAPARASWGDGDTSLPAGLPIGVGWFSYDLARRWRDPSRADARADAAREDGSPAAGEPFAWPDVEARFFDALWLRDVEAGQARVVARDHAAAERLLERLARPAAVALAPPQIGVLGGDRSRAAHEAAVERIRDYLRAGDAYQVNLARRLSAPIGPGDPVWIAARLRERAPAPFAIWMGTRGAGLASGAPPSTDRGAVLAPVVAYVVGNSPERFLRVRPDGHVETSPIKGTRPRGSDPASDAALRAELQGAAKDRAEHVMIVDLERNDLGRICEIGSVRVDDLMRVVELPTVFHLVSTVSGRLRRGLDLDELLRATFPGGSITGAPKRRAMEIIDELEPVRRGIYTGATGWFGAAGDLDLAVAIRTATIASGRLCLSVGGGIVVDSDPAAEFAETEIKARAFQEIQGKP